MPECCGPSGYEQLFGPAEAERRLRAYEKKGLDKVAAGTIGYLKSRGVDGDVVLEVGGGIGAAHVELLESGAARAVSVELSSGYGRVAEELLRRHGLEGRVEHRLGDFVVMAAGMEADEVIMNRVVCCYPDMSRLMDAALSASRRFVALTFPRDHIIGRFVIAIENAYNRVRGVDFRAFVHSPRKILATADQAGFGKVFATRDLIWQGVVLERSS